jgi:translocator assembly and maintenance protein 41
VYFNTLVPIEPGVLIKYGVVRLNTLQRDLLQWDSLYIAGRLHKPVKTLVTSPQIDAAQTLNLESALRIALLLLEDDKFSLRQLLRMLCGLSYEGDLRMGLAEDSRKVERIVTGQLYKTVIEEACGKYL